MTRKRYPSNRPGKFVPTPWSQGPHARAVHDAGGKLIGHNFDRDAFNRSISAHAPGCGLKLEVVDGMPAEGIRCGQKFRDRPTPYCDHCRPHVAESIVSHLLDD